MIIVTYKVLKTEIERISCIFKDIVYYSKSPIYKIYSVIILKYYAQKKCEMCFRFS